jgi:hypothetical protein
VCLKNTPFPGFLMPVTPIFAARKEKTFRDKSKPVSGIAETLKTRKR